jgi:hypothetical protein
VGLFSGMFKKKIVRGIDGAAWGCLVREHGITVDELSNNYRVVEREGTIDGSGVPVIFLRIFKPEEAKEKGVEITGWETFDQHPELLIFEGHQPKFGGAATLKRMRK